MSNPSLVTDQPIQIDRVYDDNVVGLGETGSLKYALRDSKSGSILAYVAVGTTEPIIYYPRVLTLNNSIRVINAWTQFNKK